MTTEIFKGNINALKARLDALIVGGATSIQVVTPINQAATYLIIYS